MANDGTVRIGTELDDSGFKSGLSKLGGVASTALKGGAAIIGTVASAAAGATASLLALESATEEYRIAQGKLNTAFQAAGYGTDAAAQTYKDFYAILGDTDTATEASQLLAKLADSQEDLSTWTRLSAGVYGTFGDALPIEGLIESANETAKVGQVTGTLADALNWAGISEDEFNEKLAAASSEAERNQLIMDTLAATYDEAADAFYRNNESLVAAREAQAQMDDALAKLGGAVSDVKTRMTGEFLPAISQVTNGLAGMLTGVDGAEQEFSDGIGKLIDTAVDRLPEFLDFGVEILTAILEGIISNLPDLVEAIPQIIEAIYNAIVEMAPTLMQAGADLLKMLGKGILEATPKIIESLPDVYMGIIDFLDKSAPEFLDLGVSFVENLVDGIVNAIPAMVEKLPQLITAITEFFFDNYPKLVGAGFEILSAILYGMISAIPKIATALPQIHLKILEVFSKIPEFAFDIGVNIVQGIIDGCLSMMGNLIDGIKQVVGAIFNTAESEAEVHSPSKRGYRFAQNIDKGIAQGLIGGAGEIESAVKDLDVMGRIERSIPAAVSSVSAANQSMAPIFTQAPYDTASSGGVSSKTSGGSSGGTSKVEISFYPREAARFLKPYIKEEDTRYGPELVN